MKRWKLKGTKLGMSRIFDDQGNHIPVTVIQMKPHHILSVKPTDDSRLLLQLGLEPCPPMKLSKAERGHCSKLLPGHYYKTIFEVGIAADEWPAEVGQEVGLNALESMKWIDVRGVTRGLGFTGVVKRYNFRTQDASHGNSLSHRAPGSIGQNQSPGRVFKGKKMAGHKGCDVRCQQNLQIVKIDKERQLLLIKGALPGVCGSPVWISPAIKRQQPLPSSEE